MRTGFNPEILIQSSNETCWALNTKLKEKLATWVLLGKDLSSRNRVKWLEATDEEKQTC